MADTSAGDSVVNDYQKLRPKYEAFVEVLLVLLDRLLGSHNIDVVALEGRTKTIESFQDKATREDKAYDDPLKEITDLAAVRIVTYQLADIDAVSEIIVDNFRVDVKNSVDKRQLIEADRFGYASVHYVVALVDERANLPEYAQYKSLQAEIQIRTVLQHAWAAIDHKLRYKKKEEAPLHLRRQLFRISALLETADSEFEALRKEMASIRKVYAEDVAKKHLNIPVDVESLKAYADASAVISDLELAAKAAGYLITAHSSPPASPRPEFATLLETLNSFGFAEILDLDFALRNANSQSPGLLRSVIESWNTMISKSDNPSLKLVVNRETILRLVFPLIVPPQQRKDAVLQTKFGKRLDRAFRRAYSIAKQL